MPAGHPPIHPHPGKPFRTIRDAALDGQIIEVRCNGCRKRVNFLAEALCKVIDPKHPVHLPPFPCARCRTTEFINVKAKTPVADEVGKLVVRRPARLIQTWRNAMLGEP